MLSQNSSSVSNMEDQNTLPGSSNENISKQFFDETVSNEKFSETAELKQLAFIPSTIIEDRLRHFVSEEISEDICQILTQHFCFKLSEIIKAAIDYMAQCGRFKFTIEDFNKGLICCGKNPVMSYDILPTPKKKRRQRPKENKQSEYVCQKAHHVYIKELWLNDKSPFSVSTNDLSDELQNYFNALKEVLFLNDEKTSIILNDIQTNKNIFQLVPYLVNFFCDAMSMFECDFLKVLILLRFLSALLRNPHLYFGQDSYLNSLSCALLKFLAADLPHSNQGKDCWLLKDNAANLLAIILKRSKDQHLFFEAVHFIESVLSFTNPLNSHYGALVALNSIGIVAVSLLLPSYNHRFQEHAKMTVYSSNEKEVDFHMVQGQVVHSYYLLVDYFFKNEFKKPILNLTHHFNSVDFLPDYLKDVKVFPIISQSSFSDFFGETLLPSFPLLNFASHSFLRKKQKSSLKKGKKLSFQTCLKFTE